MAQLGADDVEVDRLATTFDRTATRLTTIEESISSSVRSVSWHGPDADAFRGKWNSGMRSQLATVSQRLGVVAKSLRRQAADQRTASEGSGAANVFVAAGVGYAMRHGEDQATVSPSVVIGVGQGGVGAGAGAGLDFSFREQTWGNGYEVKCQYRCNWNEGTMEVILQEKCWGVGWETSNENPNGGGATHSENGLTLDNQWHELRRQVCTTEQVDGGVDDVGAADGGVDDGGAADGGAADGGVDDAGIASDGGPKTVEPEGFLQGGACAAAPGRSNDASAITLGAMLVALTLLRARRRRRG